MFSKLAANEWHLAVAVSTFLRYKVCSHFICGG